MKTRPALFLAALAATACAGCARTPPPAPPPGGLAADQWTPEGRLIGWRTPRGGWETIEREGDALIIDGSGKGTLFTEAAWRDFEVSLEWRLPEGGNSGLFLRAPLRGRASKHGIEIQLLGDQGAPPTKTSSGALYGVRAPLLNATRPPGQWNRLHVRLYRSQLRVEMNGHVLHDLRLDAHPDLRHRRQYGHTGLQDHRSRAEFRRVHIRPLPDPGGN
jgi:hypothetical protein